MKKDKKYQDSSNKRQNRERDPYTFLKFVVRHRGKTLLALPITAKRDGHGEWVFPHTWYKKHFNPLSKEKYPTSSPKDAMNELLPRLLGINPSDFKMSYYKSTITTSDRVWICKITLNPKMEFPVSRSMCSFKKCYDPNSNKPYHFWKRLPMFINFQWVDSSDVQGWLMSPRFK